MTDTYETRLPLFMGEKVRQLFRMETMSITKTAIEPETIAKNAYYFIFSNNHILIQKKPEDKISIPCTSNNGRKNLFKDVRFLGIYKDIPCYCGKLLNCDAPEPFQWINLRTLHGKIGREFRRMAWHARGIHDWNENFKFCGRCGKQTELKTNEHARVCKECGLISYPRISPAITTAVVKDGQILLGRGVNFPDKRMFSVLAGFVEPGENLEECVKREVFEESAIKVKNIQYFGSQPWPFPDSLMIGFTAEYESGDIQIDTNELAEAAWFRPGDLPMVPQSYSLSGQLIQWFINHH